jgi:transposase InsO family protein
MPSWTRSHSRRSRRDTSEPGARGAAVHHLMRTMKVSERFTCRVTGQNRSTQRPPPAATTPADPDAGLRAWLRDWARNHPRRGFRPAYHDARAEGWQVNHKKVQRLWRDEGLRVPQRRRRKRLGASTTPNLPTADAPNVVWAVDFQFDATTDGRPKSSRSTAGCATNASTSTCSGHWLRRGWWSATGRRTTTTAGDTPRSATRRQLSTLQPAPAHDRLSLTAAPMSRASVGVLRAPVRPVDLDRYALRVGSRVDQV